MHYDSLEKVLFWKTHEPQDYLEKQIAFYPYLYVLQAKSGDKILNLYPKVEVNIGKSNLRFPKGSNKVNSRNLVGYQ